MVERLLLCLFPISVYIATNNAERTARTSPYIAPPSSEKSPKVMMIEPTKEISIASTPILCILPLRKMIYPIAQNIDSRHTNAVELATEVCESDSNQNEKCSAKNSPLTAQLIIDFSVTFSNCFSFLMRIKVSIITTEKPSLKVAVIKLGASENRTKMEEKPAPKSPIISTSFGLIVFFIVSPFCFR